MLIYYITICTYIISRISITPQHIKYNLKSLDVVQPLYFGSKLPSSGTYNIYIYGEQNIVLVLVPSVDSDK